MPIVFEGDPPYDPLIVEAANSEASRRGVMVTVTVPVDGLSQPSVPIQLVLAHAEARALAEQMATNANVVQRWQENRTFQP